MFFPRDLNAFYTNFSNTMSQPYTKNQLSEKLRRLRKKFRVISTRLAKGLDMSLLSPHDRSLYDLSKQLWHPDFAQTSPFNADKSKKSRPKNDPTHDPAHDPTNDPDRDPTREGVWVSEEDVEVGQGNDEKNDGNGDGSLREVNVELENGDIMGEKRVDLDGPVRVGVGYGIGDIAAAKVVMDVFDECLNDFRNGERSNLGGLLKEESAEERWREQRVAELDVLSRRLRLVLEHSLQSQ
ncbi:probable transcription factor At3g04930 [Lycium barbarum]|uniref:probable transcription factor At3g04930 n=1 Tax=Lycium barbarum TaxID=112863 RepID=UPI00293EEB10|nr:probable transcription factor At3g04930 [Lycium barbarum]